MKKMVFFIWITISFLSCNFQTSQKDNATVKFECKEIGWSFEYPSNWKILTDNEIAIIEGRGKTAMEETMNEKIEVNHKNLLYLKKDPFNSFSSTIQPFDSITDGPYPETQTALNQLIIETYKNQGMQFDYKIGKEIIDGLEFQTLESIIYSSDRKKIIMNQIMYDRLINGKMSLTLSINYNNEKDKQSLFGIIRTSKITFRQ
jgi:hypothetical protein